jgi:hypothetical protein
MGRVHKSVRYLPDPASVEHYRHEISKHHPSYASPISIVNGEGSLLQFTLREELSRKHSTFNNLHTKPQQKISFACLRIADTEIQNTKHI